MTTRRQAIQSWHKASILPLALAVTTAFAESRVLSATTLEQPTLGASVNSEPSAPNELSSAPVARTEPVPTNSRIIAETVIDPSVTSVSSPVTGPADLGPQNPIASTAIDAPSAAPRVRQAIEVDQQSLGVRAEPTRTERRTLSVTRIESRADPSTSPTEQLSTAPAQTLAESPAPVVEAVEKAVEQKITTPFKSDGVAQRAPEGRDSVTGVGSASKVVSETVIGRVIAADVTIRDLPPTIEFDQSGVTSPIRSPNANAELSQPRPEVVQIRSVQSAPVDSSESDEVKRVTKKLDPVQHAIATESTDPSTDRLASSVETVRVEQPANQPSPTEITLVLPPEPSATVVELPAELAVPEPLSPAKSDQVMAQSRPNTTADDPFMISQMNPNRRLRETDLPLFDETMPVIDDDIARLQLKQWQDLIVSAIDTHPATQVARFGERAAEAGVEERASALFPQVSLGVSGAVERSVRDGERVPSLNGMEADNRLQISPELTLRQLIFDGGATRSRIDAAEGQFTVASKRREATEQNVAVQAANTLITLAKTQEQLQIAEAHLNEVERIRDMIRERVNAGRDAPSEMISINARVFEARNRIRSIQTEQAAATAEFREVFAAPPVILAFPDVFAPIPLNPRTGFDLALALNPEVQASQASVDVALAELEASRGDGMPRIEVEASATGFDTFNRGDDYYDSSIGLRLTTDLFDGGRQEAAVQRALSNLESARFRHDQTVNAVERVINSAYSERVNLIPQFKASQAKRDQEIASREAYVEQWLAGRRPLNDLLAAQDRVFQNSLEAIELKSELHRQHFFILSLIGDLNKPLQ